MFDGHPLAGPAQPWPCRPLLEGAWVKCPPDLVAALLEAQAGEPDHDALRLPDPALGMWALALGCYPGFYLIEALARHESGHLGIVRALLGADRLVVLDGTSIRFHLLNPDHLEIGEPARLDEYLRLFCGTVRGDESPFRIVETPGDLDFRPDIVPQAREHIAEGTGPIEPVGSGAGSQGRFATVAYGHAVFRVLFEVEPTGLIRMADDDKISDEVLVERRFEGAWEIVPDAGEGTGRRPATDGRP